MAELNEILLDIKSDIVYRKNKALVINLFKRMVLWECINIKMIIFRKNFRYMNFKDNMIL